MAVQHANIADADRHEAKGASSASNNQVLTADGDGTTSFRNPTMMGWYSYGHAGSNQALTSANTYYDLINDSNGSDTLNFRALPSVDNVWNPTTNRFDWSDLSVGDVVNLWANVEVITTTVSTTIDFIYEAAVGTGSPVVLSLASQKLFTSTGTYQITLPITSFITNASIRDNPARLRMRADETGTSVAVKSWLVNVIKPGDYS